MPDVLCFRSCRQHLLPGLRSKCLPAVACDATPYSATLQADNLFNGTFPASWLGTSAFASLSSLNLVLNRLVGLLPQPPSPSCSLCLPKVPLIFVPGVVWL